MSKPQRKKHSKNLPHAKEARNEDGTINNDKILKDAATWAAAIQKGEYQIVYVTEFATGPDDDVLIMHRRKVK